METEIIDHAMRTLWALVKERGGSVTVTDVGPVDGAIHVSWKEGAITVSIGENTPAKHQ